MASYTDYTAIRVAVDTGVAAVTLDNPPLNLLDAALMTDLKHFVEQVRHDTQVRVIVFQSADPEFFSAHGDAHFVTEPETFAAVAAGIPTTTNPMQALHESIRLLPQVTIGKIAGYARGGAADVTRHALRCHRASCRRPTRDTAGHRSRRRRHAVPHPTIAGRSRALEVILGGALFDAELAERYGMVNRALPANEIDEFVDTLARRIAALAPGVVEGAVQAVDAAAGTLADGLRVENDQLNRLFTAEAAQRTVLLLEHGFQTRAGERDLESILNRVSGPRASGLAAD